MQVIHGIGKPRFITNDIVTFTDTIVSATFNTAILTTGTTEENIIGKLLRITDTDIINGKGISYNPGTKTVTVDEWIGGIPGSGDTIEGLGTIVDLPYCQTLIERFTNDHIQKKLYNGNIVMLKRGFYYSATLDYGRFISKENLEALQLLFNNNQGNIIFYPRKDNTSLNYLIEFPEGYAIEFAQRNFHRAHKFVVLEIIGVRRLTEIPFQFEPGTYGYGQKYADGMYA